MVVAIVRFVVNVAIFERHVWCLDFITIVENTPEIGVGIGAWKGEGVEFGIGREVDFLTWPIAFVVIMVVIVLIPNPGAHLSPPIGVVKVDGVGVVLS